MQVNIYKHSFSNYEIHTQGRDKYILIKPSRTLVNRQGYNIHSLSKSDLDKELKKLGYNCNEFKHVDNLLFL